MEQSKYGVDSTNTHNFLNSDSLVVELEEAFSFLAITCDTVERSFDEFLPGRENGLYLWLLESNPRKRVGIYGIQIIELMPESRMICSTSGQPLQGIRKENSLLGGTYGR